MIVYDTEDDSSELLSSGKSGFDKKVTQIAAITDTGKRFYRRATRGRPINPLEFLKWCLETGHEDVWAFNAQYDLGNLCNTPRLHVHDFDMTLVKGRFIKAQVMGLKFYDVHNLSGNGSSIKTLGEAVGLKKLETADMAGDMGYVFRDCQIPMKWLKFIKGQCEELGIENIPATLGGLCTKAFVALDGQNWFEASDDTASALAGARVEIFSTGGRGRIAYTDINSLYPWAMTQNFPTCVEKLDKLQGYGIAKIDVEVPPMAIAPLPVKDEDDRLIFPTGKFGGVWTIHEILNAVKHGAKVLKIYWILGSPDGRDYYRDYVQTMYSNRLASKSEAERLFWKLLMNNLYGRLAIGGVISRTLMLTDRNKDSGVPFGTKILCDAHMPLPEFTNYLHAAYVLSYARLRLFHFLKTVPEKDLIYCDTDSLIFFCRDKPPFPISADLGEMKLEQMGTFCRPYLPKMYQFGEKYKAKGVPKRKAEEFIKTGRAEYDLPFKLREAINFYDDGNAKKLSVWRKVIKIRQTEYDRKKQKGNYFLPKRVNML